MRRVFRVDTVEAWLLKDEIEDDDKRRAVFSKLLVKTVSEPLCGKRHVNVARKLLARGADPKQNVLRTRVAFAPGGEGAGRVRAGRLRDAPGERRGRERANIPERAQRDAAHGRHRPTEPAALAVPGVSRSAQIK